MATTPPLGKADPPPTSSPHPDPDTEPSTSTSTYPPQSQPSSPPTFPTGPYFFYGTLMDPHFLSSLLSLSAPPTLRPAQLVGYGIKLWGPYPALVAGPPDAVIRGVVYEVETEKHAARLARYETAAYMPVGCRLKFLDGGENGEEELEGRGWVFQYVGGAGEIRDGKFDLGEWMGAKGERGW